MGTEIYIIKKMKNLWRKETIYDVAIVGAGPAGASLAYFLSDLNIDTVLIDILKNNLEKK